MAFLPSAVLLPLSIMDAMVATERQADGPDGPRAVPMFLREQIVEPEARASHRWCLGRKQRTNVCSPS